jgi:3',5'-cyclic AMP phosphodiesterase CpdA
MTRIALLSDVHGNLTALDAVTREIRRLKPDAVLVAGDLVLNGPDPNGAVDALRVLESEGALIVSGNTDIAVGDFDYGSAFPQYQDGVPETITVAAEWAHDELGDDQLDWATTSSTGSAGCRPNAGCGPLTIRWCSSCMPRPDRRPAASTRRSTRTSSSSEPPPRTHG